MIPIPLPASRPLPCPAKVSRPNQQQPVAFAPTQLGDLKIGSDTGTCFKVGVQRRPVAGADCEQR
jgi:hypothetical protein